jgi:NAD(P)-dependent dehydrogenase (short-subunit alcohol dehydrogenase family)
MSGSTEGGVPGAGGAAAGRGAVRPMQGKRVLVTGATNGVGRAAARELARLGAEAWIVARDRRRGEATLDELRRAGGDGHALFVADLSSQDEIRRLAGEVRARTDRLDVLLNNARAIHLERQLSPDGIELTFARNHLGYFLLTAQLLPLLRGARPSRIVNVSSEAHRRARIDFDDLQGDRGHSGCKAYGQSKLANVLLTRELARRLEGTGVTANALHPGVVATGFGRNHRGLAGALFALAAPLRISPEKGARTSVHLAASPEAAGVTGRHFASSRERAPTAAALDDAVARRLWEVSERMTGLT